VTLPLDFKGIVAPGRGLGAGLMATPEVLDRFHELFGFPVVAGTLNARLPEPLERSSSWRYLRSAEITPGWEAESRQAGYFLVPVLIADRYRGIAFQADERGHPGYPADQVELLSEVHLRKTLGLSDGDLITFSVDDP
jgi:CTP-dependent riboflavin kinase